jgi:hypothetical protein
MLLGASSRLFQFDVVQGEGNVVGHFREQRLFFSIVGVSLGHGHRHIPVERAVMLKPDAHGIGRSAFRRHRAKAADIGAVRHDIDLRPQSRFLAARW